MAEQERVLALEGELQSLRLELAEQKRANEKLRLELERQRGGESARLASAQIEKLFSEVATPVSQLLTQAHLLKVEGRPVQINDVLAVVARLVRTLESQGLTVEGSIGESVPFDPNRHEALSVEEEISPGQAAVIRLVGLSYQGRLLRKAGIVAAAEQEQG
jgi:molecular chaperone GrpE (heat shock protein)